MHGMKAISHGSKTVCEHFLTEADCQILSPAQAVNEIMAKVADDKNGLEIMNRLMLEELKTIMNLKVIG